MIKQLNRVHPLGSMVIASFPLNEFSGRFANDACGYSGGTLTNDAVFTPRGCSFDGTTDYINTPNGYLKGLVGSQQMSVSCDIWLNTIATTQVFVANINFGVSEWRWHFYVNATTGLLTFYVQDAAGNSIFKTTTTGIVAATKYSLCATWKTGDVNIYINGINAGGSNTVSGTVGAVTYTPLTCLRISASQDSGGGANAFALNGFISNVNVFRGLLNQNQAQLIASNPDCIFAQQNPGQYYISPNQNNFFRMFN